MHYKNTLERSRKKDDREWKCTILKLYFFVQIFCPSYTGCLLRQLKKKSHQAVEIAVKELSWKYNQFWNFSFLSIYLPCKYNQNPDHFLTNTGFNDLNPSVLHGCICLWKSGISYFFVDQIRKWKYSGLPRFLSFVLCRYFFQEDFIFSPRL